MWILDTLLGASCPAFAAPHEGEHAARARISGPTPTMPLGNAGDVIGRPLWEPLADDTTTYGGLDRFRVRGWEDVAQRVSGARRDRAPEGSSLAAALADGAVDDEARRRHPPERRAFIPFGLGRLAQAERRVAEVRVKPVVVAALRGGAVAVGAGERPHRTHAVATMIPAGLACRVPDALARPLGANRAVGLGA
jgi:hypothetical protein